MGSTPKVVIVSCIIIIVFAFFVPEPDLFALPTGFCGLYGSPSLQCSNTTYFSLLEYYYGFGSYYVGGHYFLQFGPQITFQIF
ncbi:MAG: hypothetical protein JRN15_04155 [Nitrososphaerota archaeon]|nr:hypothetical protein [Nitrososphaerota archaeon]